MFKKKRKYTKLKQKKIKKYLDTEFNIGLAILRPILALLVVITHFYNINNAKYIWKLIYKRTFRFFFHVRTFFVMSFYFSYKTLVSNDYKKKFKRLERICIPYFLWPIIIFFINNNLLSNFMKILKNITLEELKVQLLFGSSFIGPLWYQWNLFFVTIFFIFITLLFKNHSNFIFIMISILSFIYQYNGKNLQAFKKYTKYNVKYTIGRTIEILPYSAIGFIIASSGILNFLKKHRLKTIIACIYISYISVFYDIFIEKEGFEYNGLKMYFPSISLFIIFALFPSDKINNKIIIKIIKQITNYTAGVFYIHVPVYNYAVFYIKSLKNKTLKGCIIIYLICYLICFIGNHLFGKTILRNLFA